MDNYPGPVKAPCPASDIPQESSVVSGTLAPQKKKARVFLDDLGRWILHSYGLT